jgi:Ribbon-helix-helix protein, copG family
MLRCMRTTIRLDPELLDEAKALAARTHRTLTQVIDDALRETLARRPGVLPTFVPVSGRTGGLMPGVDLDSNAALLDIMEGDDPQP